MDDKTLVERLRAWEPFVSDGYEVPDAGKAIREAADTIEAQTSRIEALEAALRNPPMHKWWGAGEPDCPPELKAPNGELWRVRCKVCGNDISDGIICQGAIKMALEGKQP